MKPNKVNSPDDRCANCGHTRDCHNFFAGSVNGSCGYVTDVVEYLNSDDKDNVYYDTDLVYCDCNCFVDEGNGEDE